MLGESPSNWITTTNQAGISGLGINGCGNLKDEMHICWNRPEGQKTLMSRSKKADLHLEGQELSSSFASHHSIPPRTWIEETYTMQIIPLPSYHLNPCVPTTEYDGHTQQPRAPDVFHLIVELFGLFKGSKKRSRMAVWNALLFSCSILQVQDRRMESLPQGSFSSKDCIAGSCRVPLLTIDLHNLN